jgi:hypothetical protein
MPVGGKLVLKGGLHVTSSGVHKKSNKKRKAQKELTEEEKKQKEEADKAAGLQSGISIQSGKTYEKEFDLEMSRALDGKIKNTPWGSSYRAPPEILHGAPLPAGHGRCGGCGPGHCRAALRATRRRQRLPAVPPQATTRRSRARRPRRG